MAKKGGGWLSHNSYNETGKEDSPEMPDPYFNLKQVIDEHGTSEGGDMTGSTNSRSGEGIDGDTAPGEPKTVGKK